MIQIREIDPLHAADINLPNEPFRLFGRLVVSYTDEQWHYKTHDFPEDQITEMTFPDEPYCYDERTMGKNASDWLSCSRAVSGTCISTT